MTDLEFYSIDEYRKVLINMDVYATQLSPGIFSCQQRQFELPKVIISDKFINTSVQFHARITEDCFYIVIPYKGATGLLVNGKGFLANQPLVFKQGQEILTRIPKHYPKYYVVIISSEELASYYGSENLSILKEVLDYQYFDRQGFSSNINTLNNLSHTIDSLLNNRHILNYQSVIDAQETIIHLLCDLLSLSSTNLTISSIRKPRQFEIVSRALNYMHKTNDFKMTIPELAKASFCCVRTLEYSFKQIIGMTPKQYIITRRLQQIHITLKEDKTKTIAELTKSYGIVNQGRFAQDYFKFFNEYPSDTKEQSQVVDYSGQ
ncbi:helix-turn-helix domain-containing protein [Colwellia sp. 6_MG-2023]|uniref:AraC family transcriptional regulator n=1 Tax=Colwellia sp. 6_MG-2023 TaxID=3062676 RepID=UPI0026E3C078|nr:AraC family transcriptional regulator [Colwellia sp. 6_MG-2023]MDO6486306.1 helix-turn-helix domain-containing protein [Colwellia sp. 6_MG-2023]